MPGVSAILQTVYASAPSSEIIHHTLELKHSAFPGGALRVAQGFDDLSLKLETGSTVQFSASGFGVSLPQRSLRGNQDLQFQLDNVTGEALLYLRKALNAGGKVEVIYRVYLDSDHNQPAETPIKMTATSMVADMTSVNVVADFKDFINKAWPIRRYTVEDFLGLSYI